MTRPTSEVLAFAFDYLYTIGDDVYLYSEHRSKYICLALESALYFDQITDEEYTAATGAVHEAMAEMLRAIGVERKVAYLRSAALMTGLIDGRYQAYSAEYIVFRDNWLRKLIAKEQQRENSTQPNQPEQ